MEASFFEILLISLVALVGIAAFIIGIFFIFSDTFRLQKKINASLNMDLEMVRVSLGNIQNEQQNSPEQWKEEIKDMESLFSALASIK